MLKEKMRLSFGLMPDKTILRGDVWWVNFEPSIGGEIQKKRPAVVISNNTSNKFLNRVQVVPLTTNLDRVYPSEALVLVDGKQRKAMSDQLTTVSKTRLINSIAHLSESDMQKIALAIKIQLSLS
jgi:mRNA interferase MazF